jgi:hypothetical protein
MVVDTTQQIGFGIEAVAETDPIDAVDAAYWRFGIRTKRMNDYHPVETHDWHSVYKANARMPSELVLSGSNLSKGISFLPVNCIPEYLILGSSTTAASVHTITGLASGSQPTFTVRSESTGGTVDKIFSAVGCKATMLSGMIEFREGYGFLTNVLQYTGIKNATPTLNEKHTTGVKFPTTDGAMTGTEVSAKFVYDTNFTLTWDVGGDNVNYANEILAMNWSITNSQNVEGVDGQVETEFIDEGVYVLNVGLLLWRGADKSIYDDFISQNKFDLTMKIYAGSTNYKQYAWTDIGLGVCESPYNMGKDKPTWQAQGTATGVTVTGKDGLPAATYYGE